MKQNIIAVLTLVIFLITVVGSLALFQQYLKIKDYQVHAQAVESCMKLSSYTSHNSESGITTVEPIESTYKKCIDLVKNQ